MAKEIKQIKSDYQQSKPVPVVSRLSSVDKKPVGIAGRSILRNSISGLRNSTVGVFRGDLGDPHIEELEKKSDIGFCIGLAQEQNLLEGILELKQMNLEILRNQGTELANQRKILRILDVKGGRRCDVRGDRRMREEPIGAGVGARSQPLDCSNADPGLDNFERWKIQRCLLGERSDQCVVERRMVYREISVQTSQRAVDGSIDGDRYGCIDYNYKIPEIIDETCSTDSKELDSAVQSRRSKSYKGKYNLRKCAKGQGKTGKKINRGLSPGLGENSLEFGMNNGSTIDRSNSAQGFGKPAKVNIFLFL